MTDFQKMYQDKLTTPERIAQQVQSATKIAVHKCWACMQEGGTFRTKSRAVCVKALFKLARVWRKQRGGGYVLAHAAKSAYHS